jgi:hypothetical protein
MRKLGHYIKMTIDMKIERKCDGYGLSQWSWNKLLSTTQIWNISTQTTRDGETSPSTTQAPIYSRSLCAGQIYIAVRE